MILKNALWVLLWSLVNLAKPVQASDHPDELYQQGRFAEAEEAYRQADMNHPRDIRFRYNRACAAYQNGNFEGAQAAFSSVMRRARDDDTRFRAAFNLGNTAFKQGDYAAAAAFYKEALLLNPASEDGQYNLELAIRQLEKQKNQGEDNSPKESPQSPGKEGEEGPDNREEPDQDRQEDEAKGKGSSKAAPEEKPEEDQKGQGQENRKDGPSQERSDDMGQDASQGGQQREQETPKDLSGDLQPMAGLPEQSQGDESPQGDVSAVDRKKAEALLDNIQEDRSKFLQFQIPREKRRGVVSGKDW